MQKLKDRMKKSWLRRNIKYFDDYAIGNYWKWFSMKFRCRRRFFKYPDKIQEV